MAFNLYTNSQSAWRAMFDAIHDAQKSVYLEMYIFSDDTKATHNFVDLLCSKAQAGVRVIMILDAIGSMELSRNIIQTLRQAGVEVLFFRHWLHRTHRKLLIVDEVTAFLGGVNITQSAALWNDLQVRITGWSVRDLVDVFGKTYTLAGDTKSIFSPQNKLFKKLPVRKWLLDHTPLARRKVLKKYYTHKIKMAQKSIVCVTPYFIPQAWLMQSLRDAVARGVHVEILIPQSTDHWYIDHVNRYYVRMAHETGMHIFLVNGMNHAKTMLIDGEEGMIGSANVDSLSFDQNNELGIFFTDTHLVTELQKAISVWRQNSNVYEPSHHTLKWYEYIIARCLRLFAPVL